MNLDNVRKDISKEKGIKHHFIFKSVRNQIDEFEGIIIKCYPSIFIIRTSDQVLKSFSYSDYIIGNIKILS